MLAVGCAHVMPADWREFEGSIPKLESILTESLQAHGYIIAHDQESSTTIVTQWQYSNFDTLTRQRQRIVVHWEKSHEDNSVVIYVKHQNQDIESELGMGVDYRARYPDNSIETKLLDEMTRRILNSRP